MSVGVSLVHRGGRAGVRGALSALVLIASLAAGAARAQDFEDAAFAGARSATAYLDRALPPPGGAPCAEASLVTRYALPELSTRAAAAALGWRTLRLAAGLSQTGDAALGWNAVAAAAGVAGADWGAGVRGIGRRDRSVVDPALRWSGEAGAGLWVRAGGPLLAWASAPAAWTGGAAPPLARGLALGVAAEGDGVRAWFEHEARPEGAGPQATHRAGVALEAGAIAVWAEGLDAPLRAAVGLIGQVGILRVGASMESHPLLGETLHVSLGLGGAPGGAR